MREDECAEGEENGDECDDHGRPVNRKSAVLPLVVAVLVSFVSAWLLAGASTIAWHFYGGSYLWSALLTALILWAGFTAARFITHDAFEGRPWLLAV